MDSIIFVLIGSMIVIATFINIIFFIPFHIIININKDANQLAGKYRLVWLGINVRSGEIFAPKSSRISEIAGEKEAKINEMLIKPKKYPKLNNSDIDILIKALPALIKLIREVIASLRIEMLDCRILFGFSDPVDTAVTYGYIRSLISAFGISKGNLLIEPHFENERLDGSILAEIKYQLIWMFIAIFHAMRNEKIRRLLKYMARKE
jgi:hypothetical protein